LHQLRGRISRGGHPGFCAVFADPKTEESQQRLDAFVKSTDGFHLAETDFALRGPGELFGTRQHGLPPLRIADLLRDASIVDEARRDAQSLVAAAWCWPATAKCSTWPTSAKAAAANGEEPGVARTRAEPSSTTLIPREWPRAIAPGLWVRRLPWQRPKEC
jgi:hypothetical protein